MGDLAPQPSDTCETTLIGFPKIINGQLDLIQFIAGSLGVVNIVDELGTLFKPVSYDMSNNVKKITACNDGRNCVFLEDLLALETRCGEGVAADALLWLKRGLHLFCDFFQCLINDKSERQCVEEFLISTYKDILEPYHGWITRNLFALLLKAVPLRSTILNIIKNKLPPEADVLNEMQVFCSGLKDNIEHINLLLQRHNSNSPSKVS